MITLTEKAKFKIREIAAEQAIEHLNVRVGIKGAGCSGYQHDLFFEDRPIKPTDTVFNFDDIIIIIDPASMQFLEGTEIDYVKTLMRTDFVFNNPNVKSSCGCQKSVSF